MKKLQKDLMLLGYWISSSVQPPEADGGFGPKTGLGVKLFQRETGLGTAASTSGKVDNDTLDVLLAALNNPEWYRPGIPSDSLRRPGMPPKPRGRSFQLQPSWGPADPNTPYYVRYTSILEAGAGIAPHDTFEYNDCWAKLDTLARLEAVSREWHSRGHNQPNNRLSIGDMTMVAFQQMPGRGRHSLPGLLHPGPTNLLCSRSLNGRP